MLKRRAVPLIAAVLVIIAVLISVKASATPPVSWQPEPFDIAVPPGGQLSTKVTAKIAKSIPPTRVTITPSLAPYVSVIEPATLPAQSAGSEVTITLTFAVATGTPKTTYEGTLHLRQASGKGNGTQARPLPMVLTVGDLLYPPDPGEAGKAALEGIDSDGDGIRDDIQRYIELTYHDQPSTKAGLNQYARYLLEAVLSAEPRIDALSSAQSGVRARECLRAVMGRDQAYEASMVIRSLTLNTEARSLAYIDYDNRLGGEVFSFSSGDQVISCEQAKEEGR